MATAQDKIVRLYYLGGLEGKNKAARVTADGRALALPPPGQHLEVTQRVADALMRKHLYLANNGEYVGAFTMDGRIAQRVLQGQSVQDAYSMAASISVTSSDAMIEELKRRGLKIEIAQPAAEGRGETEGDDESDKKPEVKPVGKGKKKEEKAADTGLLGDLLNEDGDK